MKHIAGHAWIGGAIDELSTKFRLPGQKLVDSRHLQSFRASSRRAQNRRDGATASRRRGCERRSKALRSFIDGMIQPPSSSKRWPRDYRGHHGGKRKLPDVRERPISEILQLVARRVGAQVVRNGGTYYVGTLRAEDKGVLVRRVARLSADDLTNAVTVLLSENGKAHAYADGVVVVGDRVEVLQRVSDLLDRVESVGSDTWVLQALFVSRRHSLTVDVGVDSTVAGNVGGSVANSAREDILERGGGAGGQITTALAAVISADTTLLRSAGLSLSGVLAASIIDGDGRLTAAPLLLVADGEEGSINVGQRVPIPRTTVSDQGTVSTTGFDFIQTGTIVDASVREMDARTARVKLTVGVTSFDGYSPQGGPIVSPSEIKTVVSVESGGVYLVGSLSSSSKQTGRPGPLSIGVFDKANDDQIDVWLRAYRVGAPMASSMQKSEGLR